MLYYPSQRIAEITFTWIYNPYILKRKAEDTNNMEVKFRIQHEVSGIYKESINDE
jgi:hypothetical protein